MNAETKVLGIAVLVVSYKLRLEEATELRKAVNMLKTERVELQEEVYDGLTAYQKALRADIAELEKRLESTVLEMADPTLQITAADWDRQRVGAGRYAGNFEGRVFATADPAEWE